MLESIFGNEATLSSNVSVGKRKVGRKDGEGGLFRRQGCLERLSERCRAF